MTAFVANTNVLEIVGLKDDIAETFINDATVTATVRDSQGDEVVGESWPLALDYVLSSDGVYRGFLSADLDLVSGRRYLAVIDVDGGVDRTAHWEFKFWPVVRSG